MGLCERLEWPEDFKTLAADRQQKGFNVIQIVAGLYPDMPAFDDRGRNEAGFPWEKDYSRIRPEYFDKADERLQLPRRSGLRPLHRRGLGLSPAVAGRREDEEALALPRRPIRCAAGGLVRGRRSQPALLPRERLPARRREADGRLGGGDSISADRSTPLAGSITVHPTGLPPLSGRLLYKDQSLLDFDMLQTGHGQSEVLAPTIRALRDPYDAQPTCRSSTAKSATKRLLGRIPAEVPRLMFWANMLSGAAGHTYGANGIWQLNRRGQPYGNSPHGGNYGPIPWDEAMKLPGAQQLGFAKRLFVEHDWQRFEPHPEWASWSEVHEGDDEFLVPYAAGTPGVVRIVYLAKPAPATMHKLEPDRKHTAAWFDPITGQSRAIGSAQPTADGSWTVSPPKGVRGDWVVVLTTDPQPR